MILGPHHCSALPRSKWLEISRPKPVRQNPEQTEASRPWPRHDLDAASGIPRGERKIVATARTMRTHGRAAARSILSTARGVSLPQNNPSAPAGWSPSPFRCRCTRWCALPWLAHAVNASCSATRRRAAADGPEASLGICPPIGLFAREVIEGTDEDGSTKAQGPCAPTNACTGPLYTSLSLAGRSIPCYGYQPLPRMLPAAVP